MTDILLHYDDDSSPPIGVWWATDPEQSWPSSYYPQTGTAQETYAKTLMALQADGDWADYWDQLARSDSETAVWETAQLAGQTPIDYFKHMVRLCERLLR